MTFNAGMTTSLYASGGATVNAGVCFGSCLGRYIHGLASLMLYLTASICAGQESYPLRNVSIEPEQCHHTGRCGHPCWWSSPLHGNRHKLGVYDYNSGGNTNIPASQHPLHYIFAMHATAITCKDRPEGTYFPDLAPSIFMELREILSQREGEKARETLCLIQT